MNLNIAEQMIREQNQLPDGFEFFKWECFPGVGDPLYVEFTGAVAGRYIKGKKAGEPNWKTMVRDTKQVFIVRCDDYAKYEAGFVQRTGKCASCTGSGKAFASWNRDTGTRYTHCNYCGGTGNASGTGERVRIPQDSLFAETVSD